MRQVTSRALSNMAYMSDVTTISTSLCSAASSPRPGVGVTVRVSRSTSGTGSWPMTPTTTAPGSSWTGSSSPPAASAGTASYFKYF